jgi:hypothetical protein
MRLAELLQISIPWACTCTDGGKQSEVAVRRLRYKAHSRVSSHSFEQLHSLI